VVFLPSRNCYNLGATERRRLLMLRTTSFWIMVFLVSILVAGCRHAKSKVKLDFNDQSQNRASILELVPIGSSVEAAKTTMEDNGFSCSCSIGKVDIRDVLFCQREETCRWPIVAVYMVSLYLDEGRVAEVKVETTTVGP